MGGNRRGAQEPPLGTDIKHTIQSFMQGRAPRCVGVAGGP